MIYGNIFNGLFSTIERIEKHIGLRNSTDDISINGRITNLELSQGQEVIKPICEVDILISGDSFSVSNSPILMGDSWLVNNSAVITVFDDNSGDKVVHEWGDIEFIGTSGTLVGAGSQYDGKTITVTYFYNKIMLYYDIIFSDGYPDTLKEGTSFFELVIADSVSSLNQRIFIDSKGRISSFPVNDDIVGDNIFVDSVNNLNYEIYSENGNINWRVV